MQRTPIIAALAAILLAATGCGQPGLPMPPSLNLPAPVTNLTAQRTGDTITLRWSMPKETTDKQPLKNPVPVEIWLQQIPSATSKSSAQRIESRPYIPGAPAEFTYTLPADRILHHVDAFTVRLLNANSRTAGDSNPAYVLDMPAIPPPTALTAVYTRAGVRLNWSQQLLPDATNESILVHRILTTPPTQKQKSALVLDTYLNVSGDPGVALDPTAVPNAEYSYSLQRTTHSTYAAVKIETLSVSTNAITVSTKDTFPPAQPTGLAAVLLNASTIDLSWNPNTEPDLAGYLVYRHADNSADVKVTAAPVTTPDYRDAIAAPQSGQHLCWSIVAVDTTGNQSQPSAPECLSLP